jgi:hypothetical protein
MRVFIVYEEASRTEVQGSSLVQGAWEGAEGLSAADGKATTSRACRCTRLLQQSHTLTHSHHVCVLPSHTRALLSRVWLCEACLCGSSFEQEADAYSTHVVHVQLFIPLTGPLVLGSMGAECSCSQPSTDDDKETPVGKCSTIFPPVYILCDALCILNPCALCSDTWKAFGLIDFPEDGEDQDVDIDQIRPGASPLPHVFPCSSVPPCCFAMTKPNTGKQGCI